MRYSNSQPHRYSNRMVVAKRQGKRNGKLLHGYSVSVLKEENLSGDGRLHDNTSVLNAAKAPT